VEIPNHPFVNDNVHIYAKMMSFLPATNVKSLPALNMLKTAHEAGQFSPSNTQTVVEYSSGSTVSSTRQLPFSAFLLTFFLDHLVGYHFSIVRYPRRPRLSLQQDIRVKARALALLWPQIVRSFLMITIHFSAPMYGAVAVPIETKLLTMIFPLFTITGLSSVVLLNLNLSILWAESMLPRNKELKKDGLTRINTPTQAVRQPNHA
jgi:hypothetical protein